MGDHLHHAAGDAEYPATGSRVLGKDRENDEEAQGHKAHVGDGRVGDELLHVLLDQGHEADIDDRDQGHGDDQPVQGGAGVRGNGQAEAQEAVAADLEHDSRQDDRAAGRGLHMGIRQPGVDGPHGHLDREGEQEGDEDQYLFGHPQSQTMKARQARLGGDDLEGPGLEVHVDQGD